MMGAALEKLSVYRWRTLPDRGIPVFAAMIVLVMCLLAGNAQAQFRLTQTLQISDVSGNDDQEILDLAVLTDHSRVAVGHMRGQIDFDPGIGELLVDRAVESAFIAVYPMELGPIVRVFTSIDGTAKATAVSVNSNDDIFVIGSFSGQLDIGEGLPALVGSLAAQSGDHFLAKLTSQGDFDWAVGFLGPQNFAISSIGANADRVVIAGILRGTVDFDPGPQALTLTSAGAELFVASYRSDGSVEWAFVLESGNSFNRVSTVSVADSGEVTIAGSIGGTVDFDPGLGEALITAAVQAGFVARYDAGGALAWARMPAMAVGNSRYSIESLSVLNDRLIVGGSIRGTMELGLARSSPWLLSSTSATQTDHFVAELDGTGEPLWANLIDGDGKTVLSSVTAGPGQLRLVAGYTFNANVGQLAFESAQGATVETVRSAGFVVAYSPSGEYVNSVVLDSNASNFGPRFTAAKTDNRGQIVLAGHTTRGFDADPGAGQSEISPSGTDGFVLAFGLDVFADGFELN